MGWLSYLDGDQAAALEEFRKSKALNPNFEKAWDAAIRFRPEFKAVAEDRRICGEAVRPQKRK